MNPQKTDWFDASIYPTKPGWYEYYDGRRIYMARWRGPQYRWGPMAFHIRGDKWRGLTKEGFIHCGGKP